ncbi:MAG: DCC1-like thiol-disulfide oxidoreductase family protein [Chloroflexota bacterium]
MIARIDRWFWSPAPPFALGVTRIVLGVAAILATLELAESVLHVVDGQHLQIPTLEGLAWLRSLALPAIGVWLVAAALFAIGMWTTLAGAALVAAGMLLVLADQQLYSNHLALLTVLVALVTVAGGGAAVSVDARRREAPPTVATGLVWLIKVQITAVYAFSALSKLNPSFLSGSVVASYLRSDGLLALPAPWRSFEPMFAISILVIVIEAFIAVALWSPRWRRNAFVVGLLLHVGIVATFEAPALALTVFGMASLAPYVLFLDARPGSVLVVWDRSCDFCAGWITAARRLDWLRVLAYAGTDDEAVLATHGITRQAADEALHAVAPDGTAAGFDAVRRVAETLPLTFLIAPLLALPPVRWVGVRAYRRVALNRKCSIGR